MSFSVITANFNQGRFLTDCIGTVADQIHDGMEVEHIVFDACSTDNSLKVLRAHPAVKWISEPDEGQCDAFNKGVALARCEWILWLNADDELAPGAIEAFYSTLQEHPDADVIYGHVQFIDEQSDPVKISYTLPYFFSLIQGNVWLPPSSGTFFRRELLVQNPLDPDYHYVMDVEWFLRAGKNLKGILVDRVMSRFRISTLGKTSEMITSGQITPRHHEERERYRTKYLYSQWPELTLEKAKARFEFRRKLWVGVYKVLKMRYVFRYAADKLFSA